MKTEKKYLTPEGRKWLREEINKKVRTRNTRESHIRVRFDLVKKERQKGQPPYCAVDTCLYTVQEGNTFCDFHIR